MTITTITIIDSKPIASLLLTLWIWIGTVTIVHTTYCQLLMLLWLLVVLVVVVLMVMVIKLVGVVVVEVMRFTQQTAFESLVIEIIHVSVHHNIPIIVRHGCVTTVNGLRVALHVTEFVSESVCRHY